MWDPKFVGPCSANQSEPVVVLRFAVWGEQWGGHIFSGGLQKYTIAVKDPGFGERVFVI